MVIGYLSAGRSARIDDNKWHHAVGVGRANGEWEIWLDGKWAERIEADDLSDSLYYYQKSLGLLISRVEDKVGVETLPDWSVPSIGRSVGATAGYVERRSLTSDGEVVEYSRTWFNPDRVRYVARFK